MDAETDFGTLAELIRGHAQRDPNHAAMLQDGRSLSYGELDALMDRVASALRAGVAVAPLAPSCTAEELAGMAADAGAKLFFLDATVAKNLEPVAGRVAAERIALDNSRRGGGCAFGEVGGDAGGVRGAQASVGD